jgi:hypothetical protein
VRRSDPSLLKQCSLESVHTVVSHFIEIVQQQPNTTTTPSSVFNTNGNHMVQHYIHETSSSTPSSARGSLATLPSFDLAIAENTQVSPMEVTPTAAYKSPFNQVNSAQAVTFALPTATEISPPVQRQQPLPALPMFKPITEMRFPRPMNIDFTQASLSDFDMADVLGKLILINLN